MPNPARIARLMNLADPEPLVLELFPSEAGVPLSLRLLLTRPDVVEIHARALGGAALLERSYRPSRRALALVRSGARAAHELADRLSALQDADEAHVLAGASVLRLLALWDARARLLDRLGVMLPPDQVLASATAGARRLERVLGAWMLRQAQGGMGHECTADQVGVICLLIERTPNSLQEPLVTMLSRLEEIGAEHHSTLALLYREAHRMDARRSLRVAMPCSQAA